MCGRERESNHRGNAQSTFHLKLKGYIFIKEYQRVCFHHFVAFLWRCAASSRAYGGGPPSSKKLLFTVTLPSSHKFIMKVIVCMETVWLQIRCHVVTQRKGFIYILPVVCHTLLYICFLSFAFVCLETFSPVDYGSQVYVREVCYFHIDSH